MIKKVVPIPQPHQGVCMSYSCENPSMVQVFDECGCRDACATCALRQISRDRQELGREIDERQRRYREYARQARNLALVARVA